MTHLDSGMMVTTQRGSVRAVQEEIEALGPLIDWTMPAEQIIEAFHECPDFEQALRRHGVVPAYERNSK